MADAKAVERQLDLPEALYAVELVVAAPAAAVASAPAVQADSLVA